MVVVGNFSARMVNAEGNVPFKEHLGPSGSIFAEVEPDVEYFLELDIIRGEPTTHYSFEYYVDGKRLNYRATRSKDCGKKMFGNWSRIGNVETMRAFKLHRPTFKKNYDEDVGGITGGLMGSIEVVVSEAVATGATLARTDVSETVMEATLVSSGVSQQQTKKVLCSGEGTANVSETVRASTYIQYAPGERLETIKINYCTALGLLQAGILDKPSNLWGRRRMAHSNKDITGSNRHAADVKVKRTKKIDGAQNSRVGGTKAKVEVKKEVVEREVFDMTGLSDALHGVAGSTRSNNPIVKVEFEQVKLKEYEMIDLTGLSSDGESDA